MLTPKVATPPGLSLLMAALASGCVLPIGPQFDPPETNYPPYVESSSPSVGEILTLGMTTQDRVITVSLSDQNLNDHLYIRWLIDYPAKDANLARLVHQVQLAESPNAERSPVRIQPSCSGLGVGTGLHRFVMSVADRPYLNALAGEDVDPDAPLDSVDVQEANRIRLVWFLNCPG